MYVPRAQKPSAFLALTLVLHWCSWHSCLVNLLLVSSRKLYSGCAQKNSWEQEAMSFPLLPSTLLSSLLGVNPFYWCPESLKCVVLVYVPFLGTCKLQLYNSWYCLHCVLHKSCVIFFTWFWKKSTVSETLDNNLFFVLKWEQMSCVGGSYVS